MKTLFTVIITILSVMTHPFLAQQQAIFTMDRLWCNHTTEAGEDEVYLIVNYQYADGRKGTYRVPNEHWDLNDGNEPRQVSRVDLFSGIINPGESVNLSVFIMEEDGGGSDQIIGTIKNYTEAIGPAACQSAPAACPYIQAIQEVSKFILSLPFKINDSDDYIGSFSVNISNNWGNYAVNYNNLVRCSNYGAWPGYDPNFSYRTLGAIFTGDGSNYDARFILHF